MICRNIFPFVPPLAIILWLGNPGLVFAQNITQLIRGTPPPPILPSPLPTPTPLPNPEDLLLPSLPDKSGNQDTALCVFKTYNNSSGQNNCGDEQTRPDI
jgi:hypothetical protein